MPLPILRQPALQQTRLQQSMLLLVGTVAGQSPLPRQILVVNNGNNTISLFNPDGSSAGLPWSGNGLNGPSGIAIFGSQVLVTNWNTNTISRFNLDGTAAGAAWSSNGLSSPAGIAILY